MCIILIYKTCLCIMRILFVFVHISMSTLNQVLWWKYFILNFCPNIFFTLNSLFKYSYFIFNIYLHWIFLYQICKYWINKYILKNIFSSYKFSKQFFFLRNIFRKKISCTNSFCLNTLWSKLFCNHSKYFLKKLFYVYISIKTTTWNQTADCGLAP